MRNESIEELQEMSLLNDFYGRLLTDRQREFVELYYNENLTLAEIGDNYGISRQAVSDSLKKAAQALRDYEKKLGLLSEFRALDAAAAPADEKERS